MIIILLLIEKLFWYIQFMDRDYRTLGIIIKKANKGERNALLTILTPDEGLLSVTAYGSGRGASSCRAPLYGEGLFSLERKNETSFILKDSDIISDHEEVKESVGVIAMVSLFSELIIKMRAAGSAVYDLFTSVLDSIDDGNRDKCAVYFISHFLIIEGLSGGWESCPVCGRRYDEDEILGFSSVTQSAVCSSCDTYSSTLILPPNARRYILRLTEVRLPEALTFTISESFLKKIRDYLIRTLGCIIPGELLSLKSGLI